MTRPFGEIRQLGYVVADVEAAMRAWVQGPGAGPFFHAERIGFTDFTFHGERVDPYFAAAFGQLGPLQIELLQPLDDTPSMAREFADRIGEGLQHIAFWTSDRFDDWVRLAGERGYRLAQSGRSGGGGLDERFAYFDNAGPAGTAVEISEQNGPKRRLFDAIAHASVCWDGSTPFRSLASLAGTWSLRNPVQSC